jgi:hypothetical protein
MSRFGLFALLAAGCSSDPIVGTWTFDKQTVEFGADGSVVVPPRSMPECERETAAIAECGRRHRWEKQGSEYRVTMMTLALPPRSLFQEKQGCQCLVDIVGSAVLQGDELVIDGKEHGRRSYR